MGRIVPVAAAALALLGVSGPAEAKRPSPEQQLAKLLEGRVAGEPQDCIYVPSIRSSRIIRKTAIVYETGSVVWVNRPESGASSMHDDDVLVTKLHGSGSQLCSIDIVELRDRTSFFYSGFVGLGEFVPYRKVDAKD